MVANTCSECRKFSDDNLAYSAHKAVNLGRCSDIPGVGEFISKSKVKPCFVARPAAAAAAALSKQHMEATMDLFLGV